MKFYQSIAPHYHHIFPFNPAHLNLVLNENPNPKKDIMSAEEIANFIAHTKLKPDRSMYVIFPLLAGARISEILGLLWENVDLDCNVISIRRVQEREGTTTNTTKTEAGGRDIPISPTLRSMLLEWRLRCPRLEGRLHRVFPGPGVQRQWPLPRVGDAGPILYSNFLKRYWKPAFVNSGVKYWTLHSCRHSFISIMQSEGVSLAIVSAIVGLSNPAVTLGHYTQAIKGGAEAVEILDRAYQVEWRLAYWVVDEMLHSFMCLTST